jgi:hypothetical protein
MFRNFCFRSVGMVVLAGVVVAAGCGKKMPPLSPVSGKVTVDGKALTAGQVALIPDVGIPTQESAKDQAPTAGLSAGQISSDGTYKIFTAGKEGAPAGKYRVTVTPSMMPSADPKTPPPVGFNREFTDPRKTMLKIEVPSGSYDLKLTK